MASGIVGRVAGLAVLSIAVAGAVLAGCQKQEFSPVEPRAIVAANHVIVVEGKQLPPNIMLVVDRSGSMIESVTGTGQACSTDGTASSDYDPTSPNPCKWNDLKTVLADPVNGFLVTSQSLARFGLLAFPAERTTCEAGVISVPISDDVQAIRTKLLNLYPGGGTPTGRSLLVAATDPALATPEPDRKRFAMLLTDGLPNCSAANASQCAACRADSATCYAPDGCRPTDGTNFCDITPFDGAACLDDKGMVSAVKQLHDEGIDTFVIGFGRATATSDANMVLNAAAIAGGQPRVGADQKYYQANTVEELRAFLEEILQVFPCTYKLDPAPTSADLVAVSVLDSQGPTTNLVVNQDWQLTTDGTSVQIVGGWCNTIQSAPSNRYQVQISYANSM